MPKLDRAEVHPWKDRLYKLDANGLIVERIETQTAMQDEIDELRALLADGVRVPRDEMEASCVTDHERGTRFVGPHGGIMGKMPNPSEADLVDPLFEAIWQATKTWDVNVPAHYVGYCGMNGSHVMLILNAIRAMPQSSSDAAGWIPVPSKPSVMLLNSMVEAWFNAPADMNTTFIGRMEMAYRAMLKNIPAAPDTHEKEGE